MDALTAFDNAVEKLLEVSPIETLPEYLVKLRFLFEEEFDKLWLEDAAGGTRTTRARAPGS